MRTLRPYQNDAVAGVRRAFETMNSALVVLPTGTGKTVVMARIAAEWERGNVLLLAHRIELLEQARDKIGAELGYEPVIEQAERGMDTDLLWQGGVVIVGSVQTMCGEKRLAKYDANPFDLIMIDESHHAVSPSYLKIVNHFLRLNPRCKVLGVTATPSRTDRKALGVVFDTVAYQMDIATAIEDGWLVPIVQEYIAVEDIDFSQIRTSTNELGEADFRPSDLEAVLVEEEALHAMAQPIIDKAIGRKTLIFNAGVAHAHLMAGVLNRHKDGCAAAVDGETPRDKRKGIVDDFVHGDLQFLCNYGVFCEGFDVPPCAVVAMGRPTKSVGLYAQMLGRGMRPLDGIVDRPATAADRRAAIAASAKPNVAVLDFVGNSEHKLVSSADVLGGNYDFEMIALARKRMAATPGDVMEQLRRARIDMLLQREQEKRRAIKAEVAYQSHQVDPFGAGPAPTGQQVVKTRGGSTDAQIQMLVNLGVEYATAAAYGKRQASVVIEKLKTTRCTRKQRAILLRYSEDPDINFEQAKAIIDEIAANGWRRRERVG